MAPFGLNWTMFITWVVAVPGMIVFAWVLPSMKIWEKIAGRYSGWTTKDGGEIGDLER